MMTARDAALFTLDATPLPGWPARSVRRRPGPPPTDPRDRALAEQIEAGVIKNLLRLQHLTEHFAGRPLRKIDPPVQKILAIALYQLRFLTRIPVHSAVDEAVEQTKRYAHPRLSGFVNAVLRRATREPDPPPPDPTTDPAAHAERMLSHPREVFNRFLQLMTADDALALCRHDNAEPPIIVRLAPGATPADLAPAQLIPHAIPGFYVLPDARSPQLADWARRNLAQAQDPTAAGVVDHLDLRPGQTVLDRAAGVGTKTFQIHDRVGPTGTVIAVDPNAPRLDALRSLSVARGIDNIGVIQTSKLKGLEKTLPARGFDRILIDAPCSNSGVLARRPQARYRQTDTHLASIAKLQDEILTDTAPFLAPAGLLLYSTCSIWPEENTHRIQTFLHRHPHFTLLRESLTLPSLSNDPTHYHDGGYIALLKRSNN